MAATLVGHQAITSSFLPSHTPSNSPEVYRSLVGHRRHPGCRWKAVVQQPSYPGTSANYAKEMERLSAKESLLLSFKDAGGFESLINGKTTEIQRIDVSERVVGLERLNPTPRPTTSPFLEGIWSFVWFGAGSPGLLAARFLFERSPTSLASLVGLNALIKDGYAKVTANLKFFNSIEGKFLLTSKLSIEGPTRMKEEYVEGLIETPTVGEQSIPVQLKGALEQATKTLRQLPVPMKDAFATGLKLPINGVYQRLLMISYLDEEILITRDSSGAHEILTRLDGPRPTDSASDVITEYES